MAVRELVRDGARAVTGFWRADLTAGEIAAQIADEEQKRARLLADIDRLQAEMIDAYGTDTSGLRARIQDSQAELQLSDAVLARKREDLTKVRRHETEAALWHDARVLQADYDAALAFQAGEWAEAKARFEEAEAELVLQRRRLAPRMSALSHALTDAVTADPAIAPEVEKIRAQHEVVLRGIWRA